MKIQHDGDGKLYYIDADKKLHWVLEVQTHEGDMVAKTINEIIIESNRKSNIPNVMSLLSNDVMHSKSELHSSEIGDNGELRRLPIKEQSFESGFMCARNLILQSFKQ